ncbi:phenylalanine--tRNA ligase subunit beta [Patescibacteria group bacterium]|nr:phenylalanine--tRNA ligase subunit beta [Patescibacteria group bacterium]
MKVSRTWLQRFFDTELPSTEELRDLFTFHAFEVEEVVGDMLDLKVLPDRAGYAMSHRGIAKELSAILQTPLARDPLAEPLPEFPSTDTLRVNADPEYVNRHTAALVTGVTVGPSPEWLKNLLESVGQRSINNIVDISNFVMLNMGQPNHAFDADTISRVHGVTSVDIRKAVLNEKVTTLSNEEYSLWESIYVFGDPETGKALDVAGIKGGLDSGVTEKTTTLFISAGNYNASLLRRASQGLRLVTDASQRFQNAPSPELTMYGMRDVLSLITEIAGGKVVGVLDIYSNRAEEKKPVSLSLEVIQEILGPEFTDTEVLEAFKRLGFDYVRTLNVFTVTPPFERSDIVIPEDLAEEVGRIIGYDKIKPRELPKLSGKPAVDKNFYYAEKVRIYLAHAGFSEIYTSVFTNEKGDRQVSNKVDSDKPFLRASLTPGVSASLKANTLNRPLLGLTEVKIFEIGKVFSKKGETWHLALGTSSKKEAKATLEKMFADFAGVVPAKEIEGVLEIDFSEWVKKLPAPSAYEPLSKVPHVRYEPFSRYPFVARDIAVWTPEGTASEEAENRIREKAGNLLKRIDQFDTFTKDGKTSYAFRLVFLSNERTLTDEEVNKYMQEVTDALNAKVGWQVR